MDALQATGVLAGAVAALVTVSAQSVNLTAAGRLRGRLKDYAAVITALPEPSEAREKLVDLTCRQTLRLVELELRTKVQKTTMGVSAATALVGAVYMTLPVAGWVRVTAYFDLFAGLTMICAETARVVLARRSSRSSGGPAVHVDEPGVVDLDAEGDGAGGSVPLLGDDEVRLPSPR